MKNIDYGFDELDYCDKADKDEFEVVIELENYIENLGYIGGTRV